MEPGSNPGSCWPQPPSHSAILKTASGEFNGAARAPGRWPHLPSPAACCPPVTETSLLSLKHVNHALASKSSYLLYSGLKKSSSDIHISLLFFHSLFKCHLTREVPLTTPPQSTWFRVTLLLSSQYHLANYSLLTFQFIISLYWKVDSMRLYIIHCAITSPENSAWFRVRTWYAGWCFFMCVVKKVKSTWGLS